MDAPFLREVYTPNILNFTPSTLTNFYKKKQGVFRLAVSQLD